MAKRLIILRHAKSSWTSGAPSDHLRPLNQRGRRDAPRIGARLVELGWIPERVISSDSERTRETWERVSTRLSPEPGVEFTRDFYHGGLGAMTRACDDLPENVRTLMVIGHNPGWEDAVSDLAGRYIRMTTANAALLESEHGSWPEAIRGEWNLVTVLRPKEL